MDYFDMPVYIVHSLAETEAVAQDFAKKLQGGDVVAFRGPMGAGKTAFIRGIAKFFGIEDQVSSPTFAIMNEYEGSSMLLHHYDMYRIADWDDLYTTGFFDDIDREDCIVLIEWSENITDHLPAHTIVVHMSYGDTENSRCIKFQMERP